MKWLNRSLNGLRKEKFFGWVPLLLLFMGFYGNLLAAAPPNDLCENAQSISLASSTVCGTTIGAAADNPNGGAVCVFDADAFDAGVWYIFIGNGQTINFHYPSYSGWDPEVNIYTGSCGSWVCVTGNDDAGPGFDAHIVLPTVPGTTYYMYVHSCCGEFNNFCFDVIAPCACDANGSMNGSFETNCNADNTIAFLGSFTAWTSNDAFEIWGNGREGVPAYHASNFIEINANFPSTIYQDISTCPSTSYYWQIAHRGRLGTQTAVFEVGPIGGPFTTLATMTDGTSWHLYSGNYSIPSGQTTTRIRVRGVDGGSIGNFVDAVGFVPAASCLTTDVDGDGFSSNYGDCNDNNPSIKPCAQEICNAIDDDCDGLVDGADNNFVSTNPSDPSYIDGTLPVITCPADVNYITPSGNCGPVPAGSIALGTATATDNCIVINSITNNAPANYPLGNTTVKWTATDKKGNSAICNQKVTVVPYTCGVPIQVYHLDTTSSSAKVKWKVGTCNTDHQLRLRVEISPGVWGSWSSWDNYNGGMILQHQFSSLNSSKYYHYQIRSKCGSPTNSTSVNGWFHTLPGGALRKLNEGITTTSGTQVELIQALDNKNEKYLDLIARPNPTKDYVNLQLLGFGTSEKQMVVMDLMGRKIAEAILQATENNPELDLKKLQMKAGVYLIRVSDKQSQKTIQLFVE